MRDTGRCPASVVFESRCVANGNCYFVYVEQPEHRTRWGTFLEALMKRSRRRTPTIRFVRVNSCKHASTIGKRDLSLLRRRQQPASSSPSITFYDVANGHAYCIDRSDDIAAAAAAAVADIHGGDDSTSYASSAIDVACFQRFEHALAEKIDNNRRLEHTFLPFAELLSAASSAAQCVYASNYDNMTVSAVCFSIAAELAPDSHHAIDYYRAMKRVLERRGTLDDIADETLRAQTHALVRFLKTCDAQELFAENRQRLLDTFRVFEKLRVVLRHAYHVYVPTRQEQQQSCYDWFLVLHRVRSMSAMDFIRMLDANARWKNEALVFLSETREKLANQIVYRAYEFLNTDYSEAVEIAATVDYFRQSGGMGGNFEFGARSRVFTLYDEDSGKRRVFLWMSELDFIRLNASVTLPYLANNSITMSIARVSPAPLYPTIFSFLTMGSIHHRAGALRAIYILSRDEILRTRCIADYKKMPSVHNIAHMQETIAILINALCVYGAAENVVNALYRTPLYRGSAHVVLMILRRYDSYLMHAEHFETLREISLGVNANCDFSIIDEMSEQKTIMRDDCPYYAIPTGRHYDVLRAIIYLRNIDRDRTPMYVDMMEAMTMSERRATSARAEPYSKQRLKTPIANVRDEVVCNLDLVTDYSHTLIEKRPGAPNGLNGVRLPDDVTRMRNLLYYIRAVEQKSCLPAKTRFDRAKTHNKPSFFTATTAQLLNSEGVLYEYPIEAGSPGDTVGVEPVYLSGVFPLVYMSRYHHHRQSPFNNAHPDFLSAVLCETIESK